MILWYKSLLGLPPTKPNPVDIVWNEMADICPRPPPPVCPARVQPERYAGLSHHEKIRDIQQVIGQKGADFGVFGALDEVLNVNLQSTTCFSWRISPCRCDYF